MGTIYIFLPQQTEQKRPIIFCTIYQYAKEAVQKYMENIRKDRNA